MDKIRGVPWKWDPEADEVPDKLLVRMLSDEEKNQLAGPGGEVDNKTVYRMRLKRDDFVEKGFTEGCPGCKSILSGGQQRGHTEACRKRMEGLLQQTNEGQERLKRQADRENEFYSKVLEKHDLDEQAKKKAKTDLEASAEGGAGEDTVR